MDAASLRVNDLMRKDAKTVSETATLLAAAKKMRDCNVSSLVVEPKNDFDTWGIVTRKDIVDALISGHVDVQRPLVADVMTKPALTVAPDLSIPYCMQMMKMVGVRRLPVVDGHDLVGVLSNTDVFKHLVENIL